MKSFFQRVFPGVFGLDADRRQGGRDNTADRRQSAPINRPATVIDSATASTPLAALGVRRPLISSHGEVMGFEFRIPLVTLQRLRRRSDYTAQAAHVHAVLASAHLISQSGRTGLARVPVEWLVHLSTVDTGPGVWVTLESFGEVTPEMQAAIATVVSQMRAAGTKVGWEPMLTLPLFADFAVWRQDITPMAVLLSAVAQQRESLKGIPVLVTDVASVEDIDLALGSGIHYVCGVLASWQRHDDQKDALPVPPEVRRIGFLLKQLVTGAETAVIVSKIKGDVGISYRLLKRLNSARYAQVSGQGTIDQAVLVMGRNELYRWLSVLLLQFAGSRKASSALQEVALWRSRLLELLALQCKEAVPGQLFTLGLASMLGVLLKMDRPDVIETLALPALAQQALRDQTGPWYTYLQVAEHVETGSLDAAPSVAEQFGGSANVVALSEEAWAWAAEHSEKDSSP